MKEDDSEFLAKLEEYARLKTELDRKFGSLTSLQLFTMVAAFVVLVFFLGFMAEILVGGSLYGIIFASVLSSVAVIGMSEGIKNNNIKNFLESRKQAREDKLDEDMPGPSYAKNEVNEKLQELGLDK